MNLSPTLTNWYNLPTALAKDRRLLSRWRGSRQTGQVDAMRGFYQETITSKPHRREEGREKCESSRNSKVLRMWQENGSGLIIYLSLVFFSSQFASSFLTTSGRNDLVERAQIIKTPLWAVNISAGRKLSRGHLTRAQLDLQTIWIKLGALRLGIGFSFSLRLA